MGFAVAGVVAAGAIAGGQQNRTGGSQSQTSDSTVNLQDFNTLNQGRSGLEALSYDQQQGNFQSLMKLIQSGPGQQEVQANTNFQNSYANQLQGFLSQVGNQSASQQQANYGQAQKMFAPQQTALNQQFYDQGIQSNRLAARLGRAGNDPIMRNKLMQEQTRQQTMLNSQIGSYGMQLPQIQAQQAMDIGGVLSNVRGGLASQALQNRSTLLSMGQSLAQSERNYRLAAANRATSSQGQTSGFSGGGLQGAIQGGLAGYGAAAGMGGVGGGGGNSGGGMVSTQASPGQNNPWYAGASAYTNRASGNMG